MRNAVAFGLASAMVLVGACSETKTTTKTTTSTTPEEDPNHATSQGGLTPEQIDSVDAVFRRKAGSLMTCWQDEHQKTGDRKVAGEVTIGLTVQKTGKPAKVAILKSTLNNQPIEECVKKEVTTWSFPELPQSYPYSRVVHLGAQY